MWTESTRQGLQELGCLVQVFYYYRNRAQQQMSPVLKQVLQRMRLSEFSLSNWVKQLLKIWLGWQVGQCLIQEAVLFQPDVVLVLKGEILLPSTLHALKHRTGAVIATWWVDSPLLFNDRYRWLVFPRCAPLYDHCFIFDYAYFEPLRRMGAQQITFLPCAADPKLYHPETLASGERCHLESTVCLIGLFHPARGEIVENLLSQPGLAIWGPGWDKFFGKRQERLVHKIWRGIGLPPAEINKVYQTSAIAINTHHPQTQRGGLNSRAFEIPASGAFELMDYVNEMESLLLPGREVACFHSPAEVATLVRDLLGDPETRGRIARAGHECVLAEHTYRHRMQRVLASL